MFARLEGLAESPEAARQGISASDAARSLGIAPVLAKEHLLAAENKGLQLRCLSYLSNVKFDICA